MPAHQLNWFKFWKGATAHEKVRALDDGTFRTWVEMLDCASTQPIRGRFSSRQGAAAVTRRPIKHIATLIAAGLVDEDSAQRLTMHDWDFWQRWRKEDGNDSPTTTESPPERHANDRRTSTEAPRERPRDHPVSLREKEKREGDVERDEDEETNVPPVASRHPPRGGGRRRLTLVDDAFEHSLVQEFGEAFGSEQACREVIADAMGHKALLKRSDQHAYLRNWVRRDAEAAVARRRTRNGLALVDPGPAVDCLCEEIHRNLRQNRNSHRVCPEHGRQSDAAAAEGEQA